MAFPGGASAIASCAAKQQIKSRELDYQRNDIDAVIEQILFLFVKLGEILLVLVVLEQEYFIDIIREYPDGYKK